MPKKKVIIAVMGPTGAGKSTFIQLVTGRKDVVIGDSLFSETSEINSYAFHHGGIDYVMVDTPGFEDTNRQDSEITESILDWLKTSFDHGDMLNGIIYLHRITDTRMGGSATRNVRMFRKLVGDKGFSSVILATTHWEQLPSATVGANREAQLRDKPDFWGSMVAKGAQIRRLARKQDRSAALGLVQEIAKKNKFVTMAQEEMKGGKSASSTSAAREQKAQAEQLARELAAQREAARKRLEAEIKQRDEENQRRILREKEEIARKIRLQKEKEERERREMQRKREEENARRQRQLEREKREQKREMARQLEELERKSRQQEEETKRREREAELAFQRSYRCTERDPNWPCDKCKGTVAARTGTTLYYHCCFCDNDLYFHCYSCGNDCGKANHPYMKEWRITRPASPDCVLM